MKLQYLREIVLLSEELNFTKAAEKLYITQPALSKHLSIVEELVGAQLFIRTKHQVILTPAGEYLCNEFKQILLSFDNAVNNVSKLSLGKAGTIAISNPYYFTQEFMEPAIPAIQKQFPEMTINLISCQPSRGYEDMLNDKTDFVLLPYHKYPNSQGIRFYRFATEYTTAVMSSKNPLAKKTSILLSDLVNETFIFLRNNYYSEYIKSLLQKAVLFLRQCLNLTILIL